jgi:hypothetical protein
VALVVEVAGIPLVVQAVPGLRVKAMLVVTRVSLVTASKVAAVVVVLVQLELAPTMLLMMVIPAALVFAQQLPAKEFFTQVEAVLEQQLGLRHMEFRG